MVFQHKMFILPMYGNLWPTLYYKLGFLTSLIIVPNKAYYKQKSTKSVKMILTTICVYVLFESVLRVDERLHEDIAGHILRAHHCDPLVLFKKYKITA